MKRTARVRRCINGIRALRGVYTLHDRDDPTTGDRETGKTEREEIGKPVLFDEETLEHDWSESGDITATVVIAVAEMEGKDPAVLERFHFAIDAGSLNRLLVPREGRRGGPVSRLEFLYRGYAVEIVDGRTVHVRPECRGDL